MQSSSQASKPRRFDANRRNISQAGSKVHGSSFQREDKNMNTINKTSPRRITKAPPAPSMTRPGVQPRAPATQSRLSSQKQVSNVSRGAKPKPKSTRATKVVPAAAKAAPPPPLPNVLPLDPNCNEPSLPCLCCDGRSPQDNNSMFNHNHNNNNTISLRQQMQLPPPPGPLAPVQDGKRAKQPVPSEAKAHNEPPANPEKAAEKAGEGADVDNKKKVEEDDDDESSGDVAIDEADSDDDDDDDTLVPSCCDCPPSLLEFSLSSSSSSYSTSISSCSDLDSDCADQSSSICSSHDQDNLFIALDPREHCLDPVPEFRLSARSPPSLSLNKNPFSRASHSPSADYSPDEGYPSALDSPSPDFLGLKGDPEVNKLGLLDFLESVGEFGKMERFSQVIQVAHWDLEGEQHWDVLRDRLDHLDRLEKVNREVKLAYIARLHERGLDLGDLEEQDLTDVMDEMGNIDIPWKLYKSQSGTLRDSQEFSDAGVDLTAPSDCDEPLVPDSPSPEEPPPRPPKPPARHASVTSDLHTYIHISREISSTGVTASPTLVTFSPNSSSPTFTTFRCEKAPPSSPPSVPPLPTSKPVSYLTLYTAPSPPPPIAALIPPIPPPRKRHLARKEAQRLAALQAEQETTPVSLPPPTTRPPPLPPPPVISVTSSFSPPASPHPPTLPPPPSFHTLDVEIRKLLMLAGLTQAELLKLSPELGVCVGGLEEKEGDNLVTSRSLEPREFRLQDGGEESEPGAGGTADTAEGGKKEDENSSTQRTTSFTEMARRRKRNTSLITDHYYSSSFSNSHKTASIEAFQRPKELPPSSPPPPPPPRPLPPIPPSLSPPKVSTLPANSEQPERFDWLIAFTPEAPPQLSTAEKRKSHTETPKKPTSSGSSAGSGPRVTTFKELRSRSKSASPPTKVITAPEPDPSIVTPDPDILYNLKWRREKAGSDGSQWEYTSQAQALLMQPPPALTSMAALQEMLQRADAEGRQPELCLSQKICDSSLWSTRKEEERGEVQPEVKEEETVEVRGQADGGRTLESSTTAVRSVSFAGSVRRSDAPWMGEDAERPVRGLTSLCLQEKKALVGAVGAAVEAILAQFSSSRTIVQKALSGDSAVNPSLGRLVLQCLCPALHNLLTDGLKPHQSDLIAGSRPNSAWGLVQATARPGPKTQALFTLRVRVGELPQLERSKHRFNAFLLGLLNTKLLDFWLSHLQSCCDVLEACYHPSSFMRLSLTACRPQYEELLLVLQPLSLLTFNLDLLFQHHHLEPDAQRPGILSSPLQEAGRPPATRGQPNLTGSRYTESLSEVDFGSPEHPEATKSSADPKVGGRGVCAHPDAEPGKASFTLGQTSPQLLWVQEKDIGGLPPPDAEADSFTQQAGQAIQQGWGAVMRWGGRLGHNLSAGRREEAQTGSDYAPVSGGTPVPWSLGRLFGASKSPNSPAGLTPPTRRPSQWLAPGVTALTRMVSGSSAPILRRIPEPIGGNESDSEKDTDTLEMKDKPKPLRSVRTLCDHTGTGSELSFCKGEELVVLGGVDQDWIRCRQGNKEGLVPIGYTSLIM